MQVHSRRHHRRHHRKYSYWLLVLYLEVVALVMKCGCLRQQMLVLFARSPDHTILQLIRPDSSPMSAFACPSMTCVVVLSHSHSAGKERSMGDLTISKQTASTALLLPARPAPLALILSGCRGRG